MSQILMLSKKTNIQSVCLSSLTLRYGPMKMGGTTEENSRTHEMVSFWTFMHMDRIS